MLRDLRRVTDQVLQPAYFEQDAVLQHFDAVGKLLRDGEQGCFVPFHIDRNYAGVESHRFDRISDHPCFYRGAIIEFSRGLKQPTAKLGQSLRDENRPLKRENNNFESISNLRINAFCFHKQRFSVKLFSRMKT